MSSTCSTCDGRDMHLCPLCEESKGVSAIEIPDTPENLARVQRCQARGWQVQRSDGTIRAIVCRACADILKMQYEANDEADEAAQAEEEEKCCNKQ